ncbi:MAG: di-heme-cytochrome C peroxidase [Nitrospira sp.]
MPKTPVVTLVGLALMTCFSVPLLAVEQHSIQPSGSHSEKNFVLLNQTSWTEEERRQWYHLSAGTQLLPFDWFTALHNERFKADLHRVGVLPDPSNQDLPIGFAKSSGPAIQVPQLGLTCSFCHTSEFTYQRKTFRIDGGPSFQYNAKFVQALIEALGALQEREKFQAFAASVFRSTKHEPAAEDWEALGKQVREFTRRLLDRGGRDSSPFSWGPGRFDALGRGGNLIFSQLSPDNLRPANAPASIPALWGAWQYDRVQWGGSIRHPLARNIAQVIGVNANIFTSLTPPFDPQVDYADPFRSSVDIPKLRQLEELARKLHPPRWPKEFPPIDLKKAARGKELYGKDKNKGLCAHCHVAKVHSEKAGTSPRLAVTMVPHREIGTDSLYLNNFAWRRVDTGSLGLGHVTAKDASKLLTDEIMKRAGVIDDHQYRGITNEWSDSREFIARPHVAIWATAPYLHNGSVPNLYELLSPADKRHECFYLGPTMEFDPDKVGFKIVECDGNAPPRDSGDLFQFNAHLPGNGNRGHEFKNTPKCAAAEKEDGVLGCEISHEKRLEIIEYLKTCDLDRLVLANLPPCRDLE